MPNDDKIQNCQKISVSVKRNGGTIHSIYVTISTMTMWLQGGLARLYTAVLKNFAMSENLFQNIKCEY